MKCNDCKWWEASVDNEGSGTDFGYCRRKAPLPLVTDSCGDCSPEVVWPITNPDDYCGELRQK